MITGRVHSAEARIELEVHGSQGLKRSISAVIDTGYTGFLTLPADLIDAMKLRWHGLSPGILADGSEVLLPAYRGTVFWNGTFRSVVIEESESDPLVGMALMENYELKVQIRRNGKVTLKPLPNRTSR